MPLPTRLVQEGFPCYYLREQRRMHEAISSFPNRKIYDGRLRDGPGMDSALDAYIPGLRDTLEIIVANEIADEGEAARFSQTVTDNDLRRHYIEVTGNRFPHPATKSLAVREHTAVFFDKIFPGLQILMKDAGKSMHDEVMIICAYNHQVS